MQHDAFSRNRRNQLKQVFDAIRELMTPPDPPKRPLDRAFTSTLDRSMRTALQAFTGLAAVLLIGCASRSPPAPPPPPVEFGATDTSRRIATQLAIAQAIDKFDAALVLKGIEQLSRNDIDLQFQGEPLLVRAIRVKNDPAARLLLGAGASPIATDDRGNTPLHWAMYRNLSQLVAHLREQGVDENVRNLDGRLPVELGEIGLVEEAWLVAARSASPTDASRALAFIFQKGDLAQVALSRASYTPGARRPLAELVISHGMASMVETIEGFLRSKEDRGLAELYLNSGSERLAEYARRWAAVNGYEVRRSDRNESSSSVRWGKTTR